MSGGRVEHARDVPADIRFDGGILKGKGGVQQTAVFHHEIVDVAEPLQAFDGAVAEDEVFRVPAEIFAGYERTLDRNVFGIPEGVLRQKAGIPDRDVFRAVERVVAVEGQPLGFNVRGIHAEIIAAGDDHVLHFDAAALPERFRGVRKAHVLQLHALAASEILRRLDQAVFESDVFRVPDPRARHLEPGGILHGDVLRVPEGIFPFEHTAEEFDVLAFLQGGLPIVEDRILDIQRFLAEKGAFAREHLP